MANYRMIYQRKHRPEDLSLSDTAKEQWQGHAAALTNEEIKEHIRVCIEHEDYLLAQVFKDELRRRNVE